MASATGMLPSGVPDFSSVKDFEHEADARIRNEDNEPSSPVAVDTDHLHPEFKGLEERLQEMRKAPRKSEEPQTKEKVEGEEGGAEEEPIKFVYFVRLPKPDFDSPTYDLLQQEFEAQLAQVKIYAEHRRVQTLKKREAKKDWSRALECLKEANARVNEQRKKLDPYREQRTEDRRTRGALKDSRKGLEASTERELNKLIRDLEFRMEHETISLAEEKELHVRIKRLNASRPKVREYEQQEAAVDAATSNRSLSPSNKEHLEKELKEYRVEQSMYEKMYHDLRDVEKKLDEELSQICTKMDMAAKKKDAIYERLTDARQRRRYRKNEWQRNRDFSKRIRNLVEEKRIEEAQAECMVQTESAMSTLLSDAEYKKEYLALWATKRNNPMAIFENAASTEKAKNASAKPAKKKSTLHGDLHVLPGQSIPEAVVADTLREAKANVRSKPKEAKASQVKKEATVEKSAPVQPETTEEPAPPPPAHTPKTKRPVMQESFELPRVIAEKTTESKTGAQKSEVHEFTGRDAAAEEQEKQRLERIEAQKKKKAEQAKKKREKEADVKEEKAEPKTREFVVKPQPPQPEKQSLRANKRPSKAKRGDHLVSKAATTTKRPLKRKQKSEVQKLLETVKQYPILVITAVIIICLAVIFSLR